MRRTDVPTEDAPMSAPEQSLQHFFETYVNPRLTVHERASLGEMMDEFKRVTYGRGYVQGGRDAYHTGQPA